MRKLVVKIATKIFEAIAEALKIESTTERYNETIRSGRDNKLVMDLIGKTPVQRFMQRHSTAVRRQTEKLQVSPEAQELIERRVVFYLGKITIELQSGSLDDEEIENADETYSIINFDNGKTLGVREDADVKVF